MSGALRGDVADVRPDGLDVAAHDRAGQRRVAEAQGVVEGGGQQRAEGRRGVVGTGGPEQLHRLGDQGDQVVGAVREAGVVERALVLRHPDDAAAQVGDEGLGERDGVGLVGGDAEGAAGEPRQVQVGAGEGHGGVQREHVGTDCAGRLEHRQAVPAAGVGDVLALADSARTRRAA